MRTATFLEETPGLMGFSTGASIASHFSIRRSIDDIDDFMGPRVHQNRLALTIA